MKAKVLDKQGNEKQKVDLPEAFSKRIREDIVAKVIEAKRQEQPYAPSPVAGRQHVAKGKLRHRKDVWRAQPGRGISRVPRKILSQRGSQFNWEAAEIPHARGGIRAHPPKVASMLKKKKVNKKEVKTALESAISATADKKTISKKYARLEEGQIKEVPFVVDSEIQNLKAKDMLESLKKVLGEGIFEVAIQKKSVRSGKGKRRGRKYKSNAGLLMVTGKDEKLKTTAFDVVPVNELKINDLAKEGPGRLTVYTEQAIKELNESKGESSK
ncbi:MAG: 50S ribosomal protein L4 [Candidatus Pacearchaeota archaeon]